MPLLIGADDRMGLVKEQITLLALGSRFLSGQAANQCLLELYQF